MRDMSFPSSFKVHKMWITQPDCRKLVAEAWNKPIVGCHQFVLTQKLKAVKTEPKTWNKLVFGDINQKVDSAMFPLESIQKRISYEGWTDELNGQEITLQTELQQAMNVQEMFWKEKSKVKWHLGVLGNWFFP